MTDFFDDDYSNGDEQNSPGNLRKALEKANKEAAAQRKVNEQLLAQLRSGAVQSAITQHGLPAKVANLVPADLTDSVSINAWVEENRELFAGATPAPVSTDAVTPAETAPAQPLAVPQPIEGLDPQILGALNALLQQAQPVNLPQGKTAEESMTEALNSGGLTGLEAFMDGIINQG